MSDFSSIWYAKKKAYEADGMMITEYAKNVGTSKEYAFVLEHGLSNIRMYFFLSKLEVYKMISDVLDLVGPE